MLLTWQQRTWESLFAQGRIGPSTLLLARPGTGEDSFCWHLLQALLCSNRETNGEPCGRCDDCKAFSHRQHPNFRELVPQALMTPDDEADVVVESSAKPKRPSTQIRVDDVRALDDLVHLTAHGNGARVVWIHPAESMNLAAANALLKMLEEPPHNTYFVLLSMQPAKLLPTILSRCVKVELPRPSEAESLAWLSQSGVADAPLALALSGQSPGQAAAMDAHQWDLRTRVMAAIGAAPGQSAAMSVPLRVEDDDLPTVLQILQTWCFDLLSFKLIGKVRYHVDKRAEISAAAQRMALDDLLGYEQSLKGARRLIEHPLNVRLFAESLLLRYGQLTMKDA